ncbi:ferrochelatase [Leptospira kirschneri str. 200803703]|uniref:Ferrochelatase n=2 Tax=Leptospira kirschneri TaxID=29507 RepID=A0A828Y2G8_9LEPT|nr:ferrochelatase [Leptospira kirschneri serovar Grippotyphosa str. RM52]EKO53746.1 ferrochelatase [Leptospira kirschneri str. 200802841]EKQ85628.1 ferrochelatase [Leptospira kirschneri serovar Grippotyphosa str. Moskva]EKR09402.1 ferrochelatase [Leptospira kirschneri serovar Valbuzzi str. 200702274]EMK05388.1 ferrochelatase [Leptospira kirschneri str. MMD1493]EMK12170.1 ferrochelatase [Leptospira kirschneri serovar Bim str. PUO 1247]EMN05999.1 ferrochelatase [Leptospira kirschneri serovar Bi
MGFGGGSPLVSETNKQADAITQTLKKITGETWESIVTMTCGHPNIRDIPREFMIPSNKNIIFPLYPHFSRSTVLSTAKLIEQNVGFCPLGVEGWVTPFHSSQIYLESILNLILDFFQGKLNQKDFLHSDSFRKVPDWETIDLVFSAHGIPIRLIQKGDRYKEEIDSNVKNLKKLLYENGFLGKCHISFQSRVGPSKWTEPNTIQMLEGLGKKGVKRVAIYPISFVSDHLETLEEIGEQFKKVAHQNGILEYYRIPAPGIYPKFIEAMAKIALESSQTSRKECLCKKLGGFNLNSAECTRLIS